MDDNHDKPTPTAESTALQCNSDHNLRFPCYCEENVWRLVYRHLNTKDLSDGWQYHVVFISNKCRQCPMFMQRAANNSKEYVCWDYHVIAVRSKMSPCPDEDDTERSTATNTEVLDIDTLLTPYPCPLEEYITGSFPHATNNAQIDSRYLPLFRVVDAKEFMTQFYSDRSHMFKDGTWSAPPPNYKPIMNGLCTKEGDQSVKNTRKTQNIVSNLEDYIDMSDEQSSSSIQGTKNNRNRTATDGRPLSLTEFRSRFAG